MNEYVEHVTEVFRLFGPVAVRRMFGGYGIFHRGLMFALVSDGTLFLKADAEIADRFESEGLPRFEYRRRGRTVKLSYSQAPDEVMDDPEQAAVWARRSFEAALRSHRRPHRRRPS